MHEYSLIQALVDRIGDEARARGASKVHSVRVAIGELSGVDPVLLRTAYETFTVGTICAEAPLELATHAAKWECPVCKRAIARGEKLQCATCGTPGKLIAGDEILLERIELEVA